MLWNAETRCCGSLSVRPTNPLLWSAASSLHIVVAGQIFLRV